MREYRNERQASFGLANQQSNDWKARQGRGHVVYQDDISLTTIVQALCAISFGAVAVLSVFYWIFHA